MSSLIVGGTTEGGIGQHLADCIPSGMYTVPGLDVLDVSDSASIERYAQEGLDIETLYYCAGISELRWVAETGLDDMRRVFDVNVFGLVALVAALVGEGHPLKRIVVLVSDASETPMRGSIAYTSSKAALAMVVRDLARELAPDIITVGVSPGVVEGTPMTKHIDDSVPSFRGWTPEQARAYADSSLVLGRRVTKQEVVDTMLFAATGPDALNGSIITINGGK